LKVINSSTISDFSSEVSLPVLGVGEGRDWSRFDADSQGNVYVRGQEALGKGFLRIKPDGSFQYLPSKWPAADEAGDYGKQWQAMASICGRSERNVVGIIL
jgi:hypothetical protein